MRMDNKQLAKYKAIAGGDSDITLQEKTITENGTYTADAGFDALSKVIVDVASSGGGEFITASGTITPAAETDSLEIEHSLGIIPKVAFVGCTSAQSLHIACCLCINNLVNVGYRQTGNSMTYAGFSEVIDITQNPTSEYLYGIYLATAEKMTVVASESCPLHAKTYKWYVGG